MNVTIKKNLLLCYLVISLFVFTIFMIGVAFGFSYLAKKDLIRHHEEFAIDIAQNLTNHLSQLLPDTTLETLLMNPLLPHSENFALVDQAVRRAIHSLDVVKVKIFNHDKIIIYSTDPSIIGRTNQRNEKLLGALGGTPSSKLETEEEVWDLEGERHFGMDIIETYIPIWQRRVKEDQGKIIGVFEIYQDAQAIYNEQRESTRRLVIAMFLTLTILFMVQLFIVREAERAIKTQEADLTKAGETLRNEQERSARILDNLTEGVIVENENHEIEYMNRFFVEMLGNHVGEKCYEAFIDFDEPCPHCQYLWNEIARGETDHIAFSAVNKVGRSMEFVASLLRNPDGSLSVIKVGRDITERVEMEKERQRLQEQVAQERTNTIHLMAVSVRHRIFNTLTGILGALHVLTRGSYPLSEKTVEVLRMVEQEVKKIQEVVDSLSAMTEPVITDYLEGIQMIDLEKSLQQVKSPEPSDSLPKSLAEKELDIAADMVLYKQEMERKLREAEQEIGLLQTMILAISEAEDLHMALSVVLEKVSHFTGWVYGEAWTPHPDGTFLERMPAWYSRVDELERFGTLSEGFTFPRGIGLPGRVWASKRPVWVKDVTLDTNYLRASIAREVGLKAAVAIPVLASHDLVAVMVFYMLEAREEDERLVRLISAVAAQSGSVIQRKRVEEALRESEERYALLLARGANDKMTEEHL